MFQVTLTCAHCHKDFERTTPELRFAYLVTDAYTHCDECEAKLKRSGECYRCTALRKQPYCGEVRELIIAMQNPPKGYHYQGMELIPNKGETSV